MKLWTSVVAVALAVPLFGQATGRTVAPPQAETAAPAQGTQQQSPPAEQQADDTVATFKSEVKLVNVFATVTDNNGAPIASLKKEDFRVLEDGVEQKLAVFDRESELPLSIVMALDTSLSTKKDLPLELASARKFARSILRPIDGLALFQFSEIVDEVQHFTADMKRIERAIARVKPGAATALYDAMYLGSQALIPRQGRKVIVVITDGGDTASRVSYQEAVRAAQIAETIVYPIIMVPIAASAGRDLGGEHALIQIAKDTGGKHYYATSIDQLDEAFKQISDELRTQYLLAYYPSRRVSRDFRKITIEVDKKAIEGAGLPEMRVRHRSGYYTSKLD